MVTTKGHGLLWWLSRWEAMFPRRHLGPPSGFWLHYRKRVRVRKEDSGGRRTLVLPPRRRGCGQSLLVIFLAMTVFYYAPLTCKNVVCKLLFWWWCDMTGARWTSWRSLSDHKLNEFRFATVCCSLKTRSSQEKSTFNSQGFRHLSTCGLWLIATETALLVKDLIDLEYSPLLDINSNTRNLLKPPSNRKETILQENRFRHLTSPWPWTRSDRFRNHNQFICCVQR